MATLSHNFIGAGARSEKSTVNVLHMKSKWLIEQRIIIKYNEYYIIFINNI